MLRLIYSDSPCLRSNVNLYSRCARSVAPVRSIVRHRADAMSASFTSKLFLFNDTATTEIYTYLHTLSLHDALPIRLMALAKREMSTRNLYDALMETSKLTVMIFTIIWSILIYVRFLGFTGLPGTFADWIADLEVPRLAILLLILGVYIVLGMFMDGIGMLLLTLPVVFPAIMALGYDPIWFGIIVVKMVEIGLITPPIGLNCFVVNGVRPDIPLSAIFMGVWPFVVADLICVGLLIAFPQIVL